MHAEPVRVSGERWDLVARLVGDAGSVLDVGCRDRGLLGYLPDGVRYVGLDLGPPADVIHDATQPLPFADGEFEIVVYADVLEHLDDPHAAYDEGMRVASGGVVVLLPNLFHFIHRARYLRGRASGKYVFGADNRKDRHRWIMDVDQAREFVEERAARRGWRVAEAVWHDGGFRRPPARALGAGARLVGSPNLWAWQYAARVEPA